MLALAITAIFPPARTGGHSVRCQRFPWRGGQPMWGMSLSCSVVWPTLYSGGPEDEHSSERTLAMHLAELVEKLPANESTPVYASSRAARGLSASGSPDLSTYDRISVFRPGLTPVSLTHAQVRQVMSIWDTRHSCGYERVIKN